jgi:hypothetical protein
MDIYVKHIYFQLTAGFVAKNALCVNVLPEDGNYY